MKTILNTTTTATTTAIFGNDPFGEVVVSKTISSSFDYQSHNIMADKIMKALYEESFIIRAFDLKKIKGNARKVQITREEGQRSANRWEQIGNSPIVRAVFEAQGADPIKKVSVPVRDDDGNITSYYSITTGTVGVKQTHKYHLIKGLVQINFGSSFPEKKAIEQGLTITAQGSVYLGNMTKAYPGAKWYTPATWTPSQERKSSMIFSCLAEETWKISEAIGGGAIGHMIEKYKNKSPEKYKKLGARLGLFSAPSLYGGSFHTSGNTPEEGILILNNSLLGGGDFTEAVEEKLKKKLEDLVPEPTQDELDKELAAAAGDPLDEKEIKERQAKEKATREAAREELKKAVPDKNTFDGAAWITNDKVAEIVKIMTGGRIRLNRVEAARLSLQMRTNLVYSKVFADSITKIVLDTIVGYIKKHFDGEYKIYGNTDNIVAVFDSNAAKLIDFDFLDEKLINEDREMQIYVLNPAKGTDCATGSQLFVKLGLANKQATMAWARKHRESDLAKTIDSAYCPVGGDSNFMDSSINANNVVLAQQESNDAIKNRIISDRLVMSRKVRDIFKKADADIAGFRFLLEECSKTLKALFDVTYILTDEKVTSLLKETEDGAVEIFAPDIEESTGGKTVRAFGLKYPCPGEKEFERFSLVTYRQIKERILELKREGKITEDEVRALVEYYQYSSFGAVILAPDNAMKNKLAGMDTDFDALSIIWEEGLVSILEESAKKDAMAIGVESYSGPIPFIIYPNQANTAMSLFSIATVNDIAENIKNNSGIMKTFAANQPVKSETHQLAEVAYAAGSDVGKVALGAVVVQALKSNTNQFFTKDGELALERIRKIFKGFAKEKGGRYTSPRKSVRVVNVFGKTIEIVPITRNFMKEFKHQLWTLDADLVTKDDLILIAEDFDLIARALEESAIDSAKDKSKDFGYRIEDFLQEGAGSTALSRLIKHKGLKNNSKAVINALSGGRNTKEKADSFAYSKNYKLLADIKTEEEEMKNDDFLVKDITGEIGVMMADITTAGLNGTLLKVLKASNVDSYLDYVAKVQSLVENRALAPKEQAEYNLIFMIRIALSCMMHLFGRKADIDGVKANIDSAYVSAEAQKIRDVVYNYAASLTIKTKDGKVRSAGIKSEEVIKYAIMAAFSNVRLKDSRLIVNNKGALMVAVQAIFPREFVMEYCSKAILAEAPNLTKEEKAIEMAFLDKKLKSLHVAYSNIDLYPGAVVEFVDGECITANGERVFIEEDYTGTATAIKGYGLVADYDIYSYNSVEFILMDKIYSFNESDVNLCKDKDSFIQMINSLKDIKEVEGEPLEEYEARELTEDEAKIISFERKNKAMNDEALFIEEKISSNMPVGIIAGKSLVKITKDKMVVVGDNRVICKNDGKKVVQTAIVANLGGILFLQDK